MNIQFTKQILHHFINKKELNHIVDYLNNDEKQNIIKHADELMQNIFTFDKPWDMERCVIPYKIEPLDWEVYPNGDEEWCFMLNRMDYLSDLILASFIKKDNAYIEKAKSFVMDWISSHSEIKPTLATRTLDTGIRMMNMMEMLPYMYHASLLCDEELYEIMQSLWKQALYLKEHYLKKYITSNWGSIQTCALVSVLPLLFENYQENEVYVWAKQELKKQMRAQVYPDGMHWEQSTMYHVEVLNYGMKALYYQDFYNEKRDSVVNDALYRLANALAYQVTPAKEIETFGDSDRVSVQDVFCRASIIFQEPKFKFLGYSSYDSDSIYSFGCGYAKKYIEMEEKLLDVLYYDGEDAGMYTVKSSFDKDASFTMFTNGSLGSGHGHSDNLHISIYHKGVPLWIDTGRYTYREDVSMRLELKGMSAHNGILVDTNLSSLPSDSWGYADFGIVSKNYVRHVGNMHYYEGSYIGHDPLHIVTRKCIVIDPSIWMIVDEVKADGEHCVMQSFHLDPMVDVEEKEDGIYSKHTNVMMRFEGNTTIQDDVCSLRYNELSNSKVVISRKDFHDETTLVTTVCDASIEVEDSIVYQETKPFHDEFVSAKTFKISNNEQYTVVVFHKEVYKGKKVLFAQGEAFHAKCVIIYEKDEEVEVVRLRM